MLAMSHHLCSPSLHGIFQPTDARTMSAAAAQSDDAHPWLLHVQFHSLMQREPDKIWTALPR
jgi:hypothetical protein